MRKTYQDTIFYMCLGYALAFVAVTLLASCNHSLPDLDKVPRQQYSRTVHASGTTCQAWLPFVVRAELGQEYLAYALRAAQPWTDALGMAVIVPAREGEDATVTISIEVCPDELATAEAPYCQRLAQTARRCDGGVYRQHVEVFVPGSAAKLVAILTHEIGHVLADPDDPDHSEDPASIMYRYVEGPQRVMSADVTSRAAFWGVAQ